MTDIRKGDLVKVTSPKSPEFSAQGRVSYIYRDPKGYELEGGAYFGPTSHDFEVLERPIEEELLREAAKVYRTAQGYGAISENYNDKGVKAVIEFVRQYDKENAR